MKHPHSIFPGLMEHPLFESFKTRDIDYIYPEGEAILVPFDKSFAVEPDSSYIRVPLVSDSNEFIRIRRVHMWIEPNEVYPRGCQFSLRYVHPHGGTDRYFSTTVYVGMYYIIPIDHKYTESTSERHTQGDVELAGYNEAALSAISASFATFRFYYSAIGEFVPHVDEADYYPIPEFLALLEVS